MDLLIADQDIVDLIIPKPVDGYDMDTQLFGSNEFKNSQGGLLFEGHIFPFIYTDGTNEKARTFVLIDDEVSKVESNGVFKYVPIYIHVFTHKSLVALSNAEKVKYKKKGYFGTCRTDVLSTAIDNIFNKNSVFGIKRLELKSAGIYKPSNDYYGRTLIYYAKCENIGGDDNCGN